MAVATAGIALYIAFSSAWSAEPWTRLILVAAISGFVAWFLHRFNKVTRFLRYGVQLGLAALAVWFLVYMFSAVN
jgi:hypothetical protein